MISSSIYTHWNHANMLVKFAYFLEMYILLCIIIAATSVASASSTFFTSVMLMIKFMIFDRHIYLCMFNKCWCMLNHYDQKIWCCHCIHHLNVVMIHTCHVLIKCARKCEHCFEEKHDYMMNLVSRFLQLMMYHAARMMTQHLITHVWNYLILHLWQWKSE